MKKSIIVFKSEHELVTLIKRIKEKMKNNPAFPNAPAALAELEKLLPELEVALANAKSRDREWVAIKNGKKAHALVLLEEVADYVTAISKGDLAMILSSGFDVTDEQNGGNIPSAQTLDVILGAPGEATTRVKNTTGAVSFMHQFATEPPNATTVWNSEGSTVASYTFTGLTSDKRYWFRVVVVGRKGKKAYSPVISRSIQ